MVYITTHSTNITCYSITSNVSTHCLYSTFNVFTIYITTRSTNSSNISSN